MAILQEEEEFPLADPILIANIVIYVLLTVVVLVAMGLHLKSGIFPCRPKLTFHYLLFGFCCCKFPDISFSEGLTALVRIAWAVIRLYGEEPIALSFFFGRMAWCLFFTAFMVVIIFL